MPYWYNTNTGRKMCRVPDRESGAIKRLNTIVTARNKRAIESGKRGRGSAIGYYVQGDPRGCALYILRPGDVPDGQDRGAYYSRGIAVY
jgi:hypothetical protein